MFTDHIYCLLLLMAVCNINVLCAAVNSITEKEDVTNTKKFKLYRREPSPLHKDTMAMYGLSILPISLVQSDGTKKVEYVYPRKTVQPPLAFSYFSENHKDGDAKTLNSIQNDLAEDFDENSDTNNLAKNGLNDTNPLQLFYHSNGKVQMKASDINYLLGNYSNSRDKDENFDMQETKKVESMPTEIVVSNDSQVDSKPSGFTIQVKETDTFKRVENNADNTGEHQERVTQEILAPIKFERSGGRDHSSEQYGRYNEKNLEGYKRANEYVNSNKGHYDKEGHKMSYDENHGNKTGHADDEKFYHTHLTTQVGEKGIKVIVYKFVLIHDTGCLI